MIYLSLKGDASSLVSDIRKYPKRIIGQSILDNAAWVAFATATTFVPIAIAATISESYITLAVLLGVLLNREKLKAHQIAGVLLAIIGVLVLSAISA